MDDERKFSCSNALSLSLSRPSSSVLSNYIRIFNQGKIREKALRLDPNTDPPKENHYNKYKGKSAFILFILGIMKRKKLERSLSFQTHHGLHMGGKDFSLILYFSNKKNRPLSRGQLSKFSCQYFKFLSFFIKYRPGRSGSIFLETIPFWGFF